MNRTPTPNAASKPTPTEPTPANEPAPVQFAIEYIAKHGHGEEGERKMSREEIKQAWFVLGHKGRAALYEKKARAVKHEMT
ncbi:hypothetical protein V5O48_014207 [Marasmius crinis-equi]|uniref:Uncharacterized protein n=1 Tax=Marasmius crinis-equi TaxID=585013 RepID=A0ABR3EXX8_9AGAR